MLAAAALGLSLGCGGADERTEGPSVEGPALARGPSLIVTAADLGSEGEGGPEARRALDAAIARKVAAAEARRRGLEAAPEVKERIEALR